MKKIIASNFKCNHTRASTSEFCVNLANFLTQDSIKTSNKILQKCEIFLFPSSIALLENNNKNFTIGAQNAFFAQNGGFTGEIGTDHLAEFKIKTIIIGHSERRQILGENQEFCAKKFEFFKNLGFKIFYCIGENEEVQERGDSAVLDFLKSELVGIDLNYSNLILAYEPIWAIGTGKVANLTQIEQTHKALKALAPNVPLLYGGSVKAQNIAEILNIKEVDGTLIGSASWEFSSFKAILENAAKI